MSEARRMHDYGKLWFVDGKAYDFSDFLEKHPGGMDALKLGRGTDCTELFRTYHFKRQPTAKLLAMYEVEVDRSDPAVIERLKGSGFTFNEGDFYKTIRARSLAYFKESGKSPDASTFDRFLAVVFILGAIGLLVPAFVYGSMVAAVALGFMRALASVNTGHCLSHFSVFPRGRWNTRVFHMGSPFLVSTWAIWTATHVKSHHIYTLSTEDKQDNYPLKRVLSETPYRPWHRAQHLYIWPVYLLGLPLWTLQDLLTSAYNLATGDRGSWDISPAQHLGNVLALSFNLLVTVALPFFFLPTTQALAVCLVSNAISSLMVILQIVVNHEVPETKGLTSTERRGDWGAHQVLTSHNYSVDSWLALHLSGGLNMQIEHHLFPSIHYTHYPAISRIVRQACVEFGLPYHSSPSILEAVRKHHQLLAANSAPPMVVEVTPEAAE